MWARLSYYGLLDYTPLGTQAAYQRRFVQLKTPDRDHILVRYLAKIIILPPSSFLLVVLCVLFVSFAVFFSRSLFSFFRLRVVFIYFLSRFCSFSPPL